MSSENIKDQEALELENRRLKELVKQLTSVNLSKENKDENQEPLINHAMSFLLISQIITLLLAMYYADQSLWLNIFILIIYTPWITILLGDDILYNIGGNECYIYYAVFTLTYQFYFVKMNLLSLLFLIPGCLTVMIGGIYQIKYKTLIHKTIYDKISVPFNIKRQGSMIGLVVVTAVMIIIYMIWQKHTEEMLFAPIILILLLVPIARSHMLSTTYNNISQENSVHFETILLMMLLTTYYKLDVDKFTTFVTPVTVTLLLIVIFILNIMNYPADIEGKSDERTITVLANNLVKLIIDIIKTETFNTLLTIFLTLLLITFVPKVIYNYEINLDSRDMNSLRDIYNEMLDHYKVIITYTDMSWFQALFYPVMKDIYAFRSAVKNVFLQGGYPLSVIGNGIQDHVSFKDNLYLGVQLLVLIILNFMTLLKFYKPIFNIFYSEFYWLVTIISNIVLLISITSASRLDNTLVLTAQEASLHDSYTTEGVFILLIISAFIMIGFRRLISITYAKRQVNLEENKGELKGVFFEFKNGLVGLTRQFFRISNVLFVLGVVGLVILSLAKGPINSIKLQKGNTEYVPSFILNSVNTTNLMEAKILAALPQKVLNVIWLEKGVTYAIDQIPCIDVKLTQVCLGDLLSNAISKVTGWIVDGVNTGISQAILSLVGLFGNELSKITAAFDFLNTNLPKLVIDLPSFYHIDTITFQIPLWFKVLVLIIFISTIILTIVSIRTKIIAYVKLPVYGVVSGLTFSLISIIVNLYLTIIKSGYKWEIIYSDNINLYLLSVILVFMSFCVRYIEVYNENPMFLKEIKNMNIIEQDDKPVEDLEPITNLNSPTNLNEITTDDDNDLSLNRVRRLSGGMMDGPDYTDKGIVIHHLDPDEKKFDTERSAISFDDRKPSAPEIFLYNKSAEIRHRQTILASKIKSDFPSFLIVNLMRDNGHNFNSTEIQKTIENFIKGESIIEIIDQIECKDNCNHDESCIAHNTFDDHFMTIVYKIVWFKLIKNKIRQVINGTRLSQLSDFYKNLLLLDDNVIVYLLNNQIDECHTIKFNVAGMNSQIPTINFKHTLQILFYMYLKFNSFNINIILTNFMQKYKVYTEDDKFSNYFSKSIIEITDSEYITTDWIIEFVQKFLNESFTLGIIYPTINLNIPVNTLVREMNQLNRDNLK